MKLLLILLLTGALFTDVYGGQKCLPEKSFCIGEDCEKERLCEHGFCRPDGSCECLPCFSGDQCQTFVDEKYPHFTIEEETIYIDPLYSGPIYHATAVDEDNLSTCVTQKNHPCPCGKVVFEIVNLDSFNQELPFAIDHHEGDILIKENQKQKMIPGATFDVEVAVSNHDDNATFTTDVLSLDVMTLHVRVRESNSIDDFVLANDIQIEKAKYSAAKNEVEKRSVEAKSEHYFPDFKSEREMMTSEEKKYVELENLRTFDVEDSTKEKKRIKRKAFGTTADTTNLTLTMSPETVIEPLRVGQSIDFELTIILAEIDSGSPTNLKVEIYVMDAVTGISTMAICGVEVVTVGGMLKKADASALTPADVDVDTMPNEIIKTFNDRSILDFGNIYNDDTFAAVNDYADSSILVTFTAVLLSNTAYPNDTVAVTVGAEYDNENYVWVAQATFNYDTTIEAGYNCVAEMLGPTDAAAGTALAFDLNAFIFAPYHEVVVELFTPDNKHDVYSFTSFTVYEKGEDHSCIIDAGEDLSIEESVSGKSNTRILYKFNTLVKDLDYANALSGEETDPGNEIKMGFTVHLVDALEGDDISIAATVSIGTSFIFTAIANYTVIAAPADLASPGAVASLVNTKQPRLILLEIKAPSAGAVLHWHVHRQ